MSARHYARKKGPPWLERTLVEAAGLNVPVFADDPTSRSWQDWVARRCRVARVEPDPLPDLLRGAPAEIRAWYVDRARVADGTPVALVLARPETLTRLLTPLPPVPEVQALTAGLLRDTAGLTYRELGERLGVSLNAAHERALKHQRLLLKSNEYGAIAAHLLHEALTMDFPAPRLPEDVFSATRRLMESRT